jgi:hypothetical protein
VSLQACAINKNVHGAISGAGLPYVSPQGRGSARQSGVIGDLNVKVQKPGDGSKKSFSLPQGKAVDCTDS